MICIHICVCVCVCGSGCCHAKSRLHTCGAFISNNNDHRMTMAMHHLFLAAPTLLPLLLCSYRCGYHCYDHHYHNNYYHHHHHYFYKSVAFMDLLLYYLSTDLLEVD